MLVHINKKNVFFLEGFAFRQNFWSSTEERVCFSGGFHPQSEHLVFKRRNGVFFWRVSPSIGAFDFHGQVWKLFNSDILAIFACFGFRDDFGIFFNGRMQESPV